MAALTAPAKLTTRGGSGSTDAYPVANGVTIYHGSLVWFDNTNGAITSAAPTSTDISNKRYDFVGIAIPSGNSVTGNSARSILCPVNSGGVVVEGVDVSGADVIADGGNAVYATTNNMTTANDMKDTTSGTSFRAIGFIIRWNSASSQDVQLYAAEVNKFNVTTFHSVSA